MNQRFQELVLRAAADIRPQERRPQGPQSGSSIKYAARIQHDHSTPSWPYFVRNSNAGR